MTNYEIVQLSLLPDGVVRYPALVPRAWPFVKWVGGKRKLLDYIVQIAPDSFNRYLEPFVGGGAVALALGYHTMLLNDANSELMNTYTVVRDKLDELLPLLDEHQKRHTKEYFYQVRTQIASSLPTVEQAARFIYLNKTCFNGLYRVNKHGHFNVPLGQYTNPILYRVEEIRAASAVLQNAELYTGDYLTFLKKHARAGDFIYLDPPYNPISQYSDFKRYTKEQFREDDQRLLAQVYNELVELGAYPVLSNSYSELTLDLYMQHQVQVIYASRNINHDGTGRSPVPEILVKPR